MRGMDATSRARRLRRDSTQAEMILWKQIRSRQLAGYKFLRQAPLGQYILDFVCFERRLIVEIDGGHNQEQAAYDNERTAWLESQGFRVLRFWNNELLEQMEAVTQVILQGLEHPHLSPLPSRERRGPFSPGGRRLG